MASSTKQRALLLALAVLAMAVVGYAVTSRRATKEGTGGADSLDQRWDPTGSHPLPNEGVERAP